jgi:hypothetical protein
LAIYLEKEEELIPLDKINQNQPFSTGINLQQALQARISWEVRNLGKDEEKLEEILRLLKELTKKSSNDGSKPAYRSRGYRLTPKPSGGGYISRNHQIPRIEYKSEAKTNYNPKPERQGSYSRPWSEPTVYRPRERLVYDPEVKQILKNIEQKLSSEPEAEEILRQLEDNPELYEKLVERLSEDLEKSEANEPDLGEEIEKEGRSEGSEQSPEEAEESIDQESSEEVNEKTEKEDGWIENEQREIIERLGITPDEEGNVELEEVLEKLGEEDGMAIFPLGRLEVDEKSEAMQDEPNEVGSETRETEIEAQQIERPEIIGPVEEPNEEVIEKIEAQDLSLLEEELYQEPLEPMEPEAEPIESIEALLSSEPLERESEEEVEEY